MLKRHGMLQQEAAFDELPACMNLGSGWDFRADFFNVDIDGACCPDAVLDLSTAELGTPLEVRTERFGPVCLRPGQFDTIVAHNVLGQVANLPRLMTTCLSLLRPSGVLEISVPYDLSTGAWQDAANIRAFNERSWVDYTDRFWVLGWTEARFALDTLTFVPSPYGEELRTRGLPLAEVVRTPRAIDSMALRLRKVALGEADRDTWIRERMRREATAVAPPARPAPALRPFGRPWAELKDRYCVWIMSPKAYTHHHAFDDVAAALSGAFASLGGSAPVVTHPNQWNGRLPIVLAPHLLTPNMSLALPPGSILYNMEQVDHSSSWMNKPYHALLSRHAVLDYSWRNAAALRQAGIVHAAVLPIGYHESLESIVPATEQDIDVLFYGSLNDRRRAVLDTLLAQGVNVVHAFDCYGAARDALIARSKIALNLHFYEAAIFESARVSLLLANRVCVVTEGDPADTDIADLKDGMAVCGYGDLVATCLTLLADEPLRRRTAAHGHRSIRERPQSVSLRRLIDACEVGDGTSGSGCPAP